MHVPRTRFHLLTPADLLRNGVTRSSFSANLGGASHWWLDGTQIHTALIDPLQGVGEAALLSTPLRAIPTPDPWGEVSLIRADVGLDEIRWEITPTGILIPVPRMLITETLARDMSRQGTLALRFFERPSLGRRPA